MQYDIISQEGFRVCGLSAELTRSQRENYRIIRRQWQRFNGALRWQKISGGGEWKKYGVTRKLGERYLYLTAIPFRPNIEEFEELEIAAGTFARFQHVGSMQAIAATVYAIYTQALPESGLEIDPHRELVQYELYDRRFHWTREDSVIDIFVPIADNSQHFQG